MNVIEQLEKLLKTEVLIQVNEEIETIEKFLKKQKDSEDLKIELEYMLDVKKYYEQVLLHIEKKILKEDDAVKILQDLEDMREDEDDLHYIFISNVILEILVQLILNSIISHKRWSIIIVFITII